jgi:adenine deaminase
MHILIREGSAARNFDALIPLLNSYPEKVMLCSDDKHPDDLVRGHINKLIIRALRSGYDPMSVIRACTLNPVKHYKLPSGLLQTGDPADIVIVDNLEEFNVIKTFLNGILVACDGESLLHSFRSKTPNRFQALHVTASDIEVRGGEGKMKVIQAFDGSLFTEKILELPLLQNGLVNSDVPNDILKITVINRYVQSKPAVAFIKGFGLKRGAIASTVAHDSHNIICVGTNDTDMVSSINSLIDLKGGIAVSEGQNGDVLPLPVAGLMAVNDGYEVAGMFEKINGKAVALGSSLVAPFMTLSFMALLVIPELKLSDRGLFDGTRFSFTGLFEAD